MKIFSSAEKLSEADTSTFVFTYIIEIFHTKLLVFVSLRLKPYFIDKSALETNHLFIPSQKYIQSLLTVANLHSYNVLN